MGITIFAGMADVTALLLLLLAAAAARRRRCIHSLLRRRCVVASVQLARSLAHAHRTSHPHCL